MINFDLPKNNKRYKIIKTAYFKPVYDENWKMTNRDFLLCTIKDIDTNQNMVRMFIEPEIDWYMVKEEYQQEIEYPLISIENHKVERHTCKYRERDKDILKSLGIWETAWQIKKINYHEYTQYLKENVKNNPYLYASDINIEDFYKTEFEIQYGSFDIFPLKCSFFDIEVDISEYMSSVSNPQTPINAISYFVDESKIMRCFLLNYPDNKDQLDVKENPIKFISEYCTNDLIDDPEVSFEFLWFDNDVDLMRAFWRTVNNEKCDFLSAWNSPYDMKYQLNRAKLFNIDIPNMMCDSSFHDEFKRINYIEDPDRNRSTEKYFHRMWDWVDISSQTMIVDQMSLYSNLRKRFQLNSYGLYFVAKTDLGITKVDLSSYGLTIKNAHKEDYKRFLQYSIMDTYLLYLLEKKNQDLINLVSLSENTRIQKGINVSILIKNTLDLYFRRENKIIGNTIDYNIWESVPGALVASPDNIKIKSAPCFGENQTLIFDNCIDLDAASLYPSIMLTSNVCKNTIKKRYLYLYEPNHPDEILMSGSDFFEALQTEEGSIISLAKDLFNLPSVEEMVEKFNNQL